MDKAIIVFSDGSTLEVSAGDRLIPVVYCPPLEKDHDNKNFASMDQPIELQIHIHDGLIPSILSVFANCDFFYLNRDTSVVYNSKSVVRIESK